METKIKKKYLDESLGFPVVLLNAPLIKVHGQWALHVNYNGYQQAVLNLLAQKPSRLTGYEVQFVRKYFVMTVRAFADRFSVKHPAVIKWEKKRNDPTLMAWSTEKDIRLFILDELQKNAGEIRELYRSLREVAGGIPEPLVVNGTEVAA